jgi:hypothetical protein
VITGIEAPVAVAGAEVRTAVAVTASVPASARYVIFIVLVAAVPTVVVEVAAPSVTASALTVALEEVAEIDPATKASTVVSANFLKNVFVDISFLSLRVESGPFPKSAWLRIGDSCVMSASFCAS